MNPNRLAKLEEVRQKNSADAILVSKPVHLHYFSGFRGYAAHLLITPQRKILVTDSRYTEQAAKEAPLFTVEKQESGLLIHTTDLIKEQGVKNLAFEGNALLYDDYVRLKDLLPGVTLTAVKLNELRQVKEPQEIEYIKKACAIADEAFSQVLTFIRPGLTEKEVAWFLDSAMLKLGAEKPSFDTIVVSGERGSLPHGVATEKLLNAGDFVTMDFGAVYQGYHSDMTRTIALGQVSERQRDLYNTVLRAQLMAVENIRPGAAGKAVDKTVRDYLDAKGLGEYFGHGLGHSLGLEIHEEPRLSKLSTCEALLPNMLVTAEPGVYIPGFGGLRIEDTVLVTASGAEPLTHSPKELIVI
ncbi:MAG: aminopeptidase P family protein [Selenomonadaceae bacterium]|nr:aminopeptidase P family protein [Selenomonadaceae bacterium]